MQTLLSAIMILSTGLFLLLLAYYGYIVFKRQQWLNRLFHIYDAAIITDAESRHKSEFKLKLLQAGLTQKEFNEIVGVSIVAGAALTLLVFVLDLGSLQEIMLVCAGALVAVGMPILYLFEQTKARIKRIDDDLAVFIDLLIIILEGGGGLNNAIDEVTTQATKVIGRDLLEESKRFKYELITYGSEIAYANLIKRTGSEAVATIVGFMKLSEETGIGVKTIFENQSKEIRQSQALSIKKQSTTMNIYITFTMFIFILPAIIAMIAFPVAAGALLKLF